MTEVEVKGSPVKSVVKSVMVLPFLPVFFYFVVSCDLSVEVNEWCKEMGAAAWPSCDV